MQHASYKKIYTLPKFDSVKGWLQVPTPYNHVSTSIRKKNSLWTWHVMTVLGQFLQCICHHFGNMRFLDLEHAGHKVAQGFDILQDLSCTVRSNFSHENLRHHANIGSNRKDVGRWLHINDLLQLRQAAAAIDGFILVKILLPAEHQGGESFHSLNLPQAWRNMSGIWWIEVDSREVWSQIV